MTTFLIEKIERNRVKFRHFTGAQKADQRPESGTNKYCIVFTATNPSTNVERGKTDTTILHGDLLSSECSLRQHEPVTARIRLQHQNLKGGIFSLRIRVRNTDRNCLISLIIEARNKCINHSAVYHFKDKSRRR